MLLAVGFTALLLLTSGVSPVTVLPPENVTVSCENFKVTVSWEYSEQQPHTTFRVNILSPAGPSENKTTDHKIDLSDVIWASQDHYMGYHYVTVTAIQGGNQSEAVTSESFSFNELKTIDIYCELVFPPVELIETDSGATVKFKNPLLSYEKLKQAVKSDATFFAFSVISDSGEYRKNCDKGSGIDCEDCTLKDEICKHDILFPEGTKKCVTLKGWLFDKNRFGLVPFKESPRICAIKPDEVPVIMLVTLLSLTALIISVLTVCICKVKAWTMETPKSSPNSLLPKHNERDSQFVNITDVNMDISAVRFTDKSCKTPSVSSEEENDPTDYFDRSSGSDVPPSSCFYTDGRDLEGSDQELEAVGLMSEENTTDNDSADNSVKTECVSMNLEEEEKEESAYDSPHAPQVDTHDKDMVTAYREK